MLRRAEPRSYTVFILLYCPQRPEQLPNLLLTKGSRPPHALGRHSVLRLGCGMAGWFDGPQRPPSTTPKSAETPVPGFGVVTIAAWGLTGRGR
jgi:hypothetical protein